MNIQVDTDLVSILREELVALKAGPADDYDRSLLSFVCAIGQAARDLKAANGLLEEALGEAERDNAIYTLALLVEMERKGGSLQITPERAVRLPDQIGIQWVQDTSGTVTVSTVNNCRERGDC